jgi:hypothetical protein
MLFMAVYTDSIRYELIRKIDKYFESLTIFSKYEEAINWLERNLNHVSPNLAILEWRKDSNFLRSIEEICKLLANQSSKDDILIVLCAQDSDTISIHEYICNLNFLGSLRIFCTTDFSINDAPSAFGLNSDDYSIQRGKLTLWPSKFQVFNAAAVDLGSSPSEVPYIKLTENRTKVLEYLMTYAFGKENRKNAEEIIQGIWIINQDAYSPKNIHDAIHGLRAQIEIDPTKPVIIMAKRGRHKGGYWINDNSDNF